MTIPRNDFPVNTHPRYMKVIDAAMLLGCSVSQIYALIDSGKLGCYRISTKSQGGIRIDEEAHLLPFLKSVEQGGEQQAEEPPQAAPSAPSVPPSDKTKIDLW